MAELHPDPRRHAPPSWVAALERARADVAAGRTEDAAAVLDRLEREDAQRDEHAPHRAAANG
jgi:hypothetical protein